MYICNNCGAVNKVTELPPGGNQRSQANPLNFSLLQSGFGQGKVQPGEVCSTCNQRFDIAKVWGATPGAMKCPTCGMAFRTLLPSIGLLRSEQQILSNLRNF